MNAGAVSFAFVTLSDGTSPAAPICQWAVFHSRRQGPPKIFNFRRSLVRPAAFEAMVCKVGVIRPSKGKPLRRKGFGGVAQILRHFQEIPGAIAPQQLQAFFKQSSNSSQRSEAHQAVSSASTPCSYKYSGAMSISPSFQTAMPRSI